MYEFEDDLQYCNLFTIMTRVNLCLLYVKISCNEYLKDFRDTFKDMEIVLVDTEEGHFNFSGREHHIKTLIEPSSLLNISTSFSKKILDVLAALLCAEEYSKLSLLKGYLNEYVRIDTNALSSLDVFGNTPTSLYKLLNRCCTKRIGSALLKSFLLKPLISKEKILQRQEVVQGFTTNVENLDKLRSILKSLPDIYKLINSVEKQNASLENLYSLYLVVSYVPRIVKCLRKSDASKTSYATQIANTLAALNTDEKLGKFAALVETVLDFEFVPREFKIRTDHDDSGELEALTTELISIMNDIDKEKSHLKNNVLEGFSPKFETERKFLKTYGYHFRISKKHDNILKQLPGDYIYLRVVNAGIRWTSKKLQLLSQKELNIKKQISVAESSLLVEAIEVTKTFLLVFEDLVKIIAEIDVLASFALVSFYAPEPFVKPAFNNESKFIIRKARHPTLELLENMDFVCNDYDIQPESKLQVITGPNTGGKSVYLRQIGVICLLAQIGCFVPAEIANLSIVDAIFTRIGADDDQTKGVSTFMSEMLESSSLIRAATSNSLAIVDEIGRGTSTAEGYGLAYGIAHFLATKTKCFTLFATHFHELTDLKNDVPCVENMFFDAVTTEDKVVMLYKIKQGVCNKSYGINIAKMIGFPERVLRDAERKLKELETFGKVEENPAKKIKV